MWKDGQKGLGTGRVGRDLPGPPGYSSENCLVPLEQNDSGYFHSNCGVCTSSHHLGAWYKHRFTVSLRPVSCSTMCRRFLHTLRSDEHPRGAQALRDILGDVCQCSHLHLTFSICEDAVQKTVVTKLLVRAGSGLKVLEVTMTQKHEQNSIWRERRSEGPASGLEPFPDWLNDLDEVTLALTPCVPQFCVHAPVLSTPPFPLYSV